MQPIFLELHEVLEVHRDQIERYGGAEGFRDAGLLESAIAMPQAGSGEEYFHSDLFEMAAAYLFHIIKNHPLVDGNKRVGVASALVFFKLNGIEIDISNSKLVDLALAVAEGRFTKSEVAELFRKHFRP